MDIRWAWHFSMFNPVLYDTLQNGNFFSQTYSYELSCIDLSLPLTKLALPFSGESDVAFVVGSRVVGARVVGARVVGARVVGSSPGIFGSISICHPR